MEGVVMELAGKNVLVTGGAGFVGSHIVGLLLEKNANVVVIDLQKEPKSYLVTEGFDKKVTFIKGDIRDYDLLAKIVSEHDINVVFHLAAQPIVTIAHKNPTETLDHNINGTINVLEIIRNTPSIKAVVVASSDKSYGESNVLPYVETHPLVGSDPYSVSKSCTDLIAQAYAKSYDLPICVTRFGNIYGPGDLNSNRIVPSTVKAIIDDSTLEIRSDGKMIRQYVYVKDVARGYIVLAENIEKVRGDVFNLASDAIFGVLDFSKKIAEICNVKLKYVILNTAINEIPDQYLSYEKVKRVIDWRPEYNLERAIPETVDWYKRNLT